MDIVARHPVHPYSCSRHYRVCKIEKKTGRYYVCEWENRDGYLKVRKPGAEGCIGAHVIIYEMFYGVLPTSLAPDGTRWVVHHKNGDRRDNNPDNLELMSSREHSRLTAKEREAAGLPKRWHTPDEIQTIRLAFMRGESEEAIVIGYDIKLITLVHMLGGRNWGGLPWPGYPPGVLPRCVIDYRRRGRNKGRPYGQKEAA
jgi:hypothetical protein